MDFVTAAIILSWLAIALLGLAMAGLMRQVQWLTAGGRALQQVGPTIGTQVPGLPGIDFGAARETVVVFLSDDCPLCNDLTAESKRLAVATADDDVRLVVAHVGAGGSDGPGTASISEEQLRLWQVSLTPFAVRVGRDRRIVDTAPIESLATLRSLTGRMETRQEVAA